MKQRCLLPLLLVILTIDLPTMTGVHLSKIALQRVSQALRNKSFAQRRVRRQIITDPQPYLPITLKNKKLDVPIPTNIGHFPGGSHQIDRCDRDEVMMKDGTCQKILTDGNCKHNEEVILDPETNKGFCAPRICPPDRVFVPATQLCHDPLDIDVCPAGRELYYSAYGTGVCTCPDGTVEGDDDLDDDVCEVVLGESLQCQPGQVFWFKDFNSPPQCLPDPCNGANLNRGQNDLPFVPSVTGKCFQLGQSQGVCPSGQYYVLALDDLRGECSTLEDAGYNVFNPDELQTLKNMFGNRFNLRSISPIQALPDSKHTGSGYPGNVSANIILNQNNAVRGQGNFGQGEHSQGNQNAIKHGNNQPNQGFGQVLGGNQNIAPGNQQNRNGQLRPQNQQIQANNQNGRGQFGQQNNQTPFRQQNNQNSFRQQNSQRPLNQQNNHQQNQPSNQGQFNQQNRRPLNQIQSNQPNINLPFNPQNIQGQPSPQTAQVNNQKQICTFIQAIGQKRCTAVPGNQPFNSLESSGHGSVNSHSPETFGGPSPPLSFEQNSPSFDTYGYRFGRSLGFKHPPVRAILTNHFSILPNGERIIHLQTLNRHPRDIQEGSLSVLQVRLLAAQGSSSSKVLSRKKRNLLSYASPSNVFETRLLGCRPGAVRDINAKCRNTILPARIPKRRGTRAAPPVPPTPSCPNGMAFNIRRQCVPATTAQNSLIAFNLG